MFFKSFLNLFFNCVNFDSLIMPKTHHINVIKHNK